ncbi:MAG: type IX secretion system membrane protein PorP/SprF [Bacteroidetes bacterium]|nr:type IX secretion system membrane protein PorP/SprF [Bacteroidota bacterium]
MKKNIFTICLLAAATHLWAQQEHHYTQFMYNKLLLNPGYAGARGVPSITGIYRSQWIGYEGAPQSALFSFNSPFLSPRVGVGLTLTQERIGLHRDTYGALAYSYELAKSENLSVRLGIMGSIRSRGYDFAKVSTDPQQIFDPSVGGNTFVRDYTGNVGAGIYATVSQQFYVGFSIPHIYQNNIGRNTDVSANLQGKEIRHFYGNAGAILPISDDINLMPAVLVKYVKNVPLDADINLNLDIRKKVTAGLSYRLGGDGAGESLDLLFFWQISNQLGFGAAYDFTLSRLKNYSSGSVEIMLQADLKKTAKGKKSGKKNMTNPRFFM